MKIVVIDGQGGKIGQALITALKAAGAKGEIYALGTNAAATAAMLKAGADCGATGENPVVVAARDADIIVGPLGIAVADALLGEVTPEMAVAVGRSPAQKILIPLNKCGISVAGLSDLPFSEAIQRAAALVLAHQGL